MSDHRRRSHEPGANPAPIIVDREPELYNLFSPSSTRTRRVIITESRTGSRRKQRIERLPSPSPPPRTTPSRVLDPSLHRAHRHSTSATMPEPHVPLPPRIVPDPQNPRPAHQRQASTDTIRPVVEERSPDNRPRIYAHPYEVREQVVESPPPENRRSANYETRNQPVRSRPALSAEAQEIARMRAESLHRSQQLEDAQETIAILRQQLAQAARETEQEKRRATRIGTTLGACEEQCRLLEREKTVVAKEAQLAREKSAEARAVLEQERQDHSRERALQAQQPQQRTTRQAPEIVQNYRPGEPRTVPSSRALHRLDTRVAARPAINDPARDAIRRAQEDVRRGEST